MDEPGRETVPLVFESVLGELPTITGPACSVPGCGHWESEHQRNHCSMCHAYNPHDRTCLHYYFPPKVES